MRKQTFKLDLNENAADIDRLVLLKLQRQLAGAYCYARANDELLAKRAIAKYNKVAAENIVLTNGSYHALELLSGFLLGKNDEMVILAPTFPFYDKFEKYKKFKIKKVYYHGAEIDINEIVKALTKKTRVVYIANPNNPIGLFFARKDLLKLIKICEKKKIFALIDEAYCEFGGESVIDLIEKYKSLIVLRTFSKFLGLAGIKVGYIVVNSARAEEFEFVRGPSFAISKFGLIAAETILRNPKLIKKYKQEIDMTRKVFFEYCLQNKLFFYPAVTNFVVIKLDDAKRFVEYMNKNGILVKSLDDYIDDKNKVLKNCVRVTLAPMNKMKYFFAVFDGFLKV